jgi:hypothetical protein
MPVQLSPTFAKPTRHKEPAAHIVPRVETMMTSEKTVPSAQTQRRRDEEIDGRYGAIGIAAVAAASRYPSIGKAKPPASRQGEDDRSDQAA